MENLLTGFDDHSPGAAQYQRPVLGEGSMPPQMALCKIWTVTSSPTWPHAGWRRADNAESPGLIDELMGHLKRKGRKLSRVAAKLLLTSAA